MWQIRYNFIKNKIYQEYDNETMNDQINITFVIFFVVNSKVMRICHTVTLEMGIWIKKSITYLLSYLSDSSLTEKGACSKTRFKAVICQCIYIQRLYERISNKELCYVTVVLATYKIRQ